VSRRWRIRTFWLLFVAFFAMLALAVLTRPWVVWLAMIPGVGMSWWAFAPVGVWPWPSPEHGNRKATR